MTIRFVIRALAVLGAAATLATCASYPEATRYPIHADGPPPPARAATSPAAPVPSGEWELGAIHPASEAPLAARAPATPAVPVPSREGVRGAIKPANDAPPPRTAPVDSIEGGALEAPANTGAGSAAGTASEGFTEPPPPVRSGSAVTAGADHESHPGDTVSWIGLGFQMPVQSSILSLSLGFALACISVAILLSLFRLVRGPTSGDRILAVDTLTINVIALIMVFGIAEATTTYFESALLLAMVAFVATVAYCKFLLRGDIVE
jgi:multicomponent K+:H+ antiporter subunit F